MLLGHTKWRLNIYFSEWDTEYLNIMENIQEPEVVILEFVIWMIALYILISILDSFVWSILPQMMKILYMQRLQKRDAQSR